MSEIKSGDVVCLKSGSPYMTVFEVIGDNAVCWFLNLKNSNNVNGFSEGVSVPLIVLKKVDNNTQPRIDDNCKMVLNATALSPRK